MSYSVGVVVPAYAPDVPRMVAYLESIRALPVERVHVEVDAPEPGVLEALSALDVSVYAAPGRRGKGAAVAHGFDTLDTDVLAFADADGATPVDSLRAVLEGTERADLSVGSRRHPDAVVAVTQSPVREAMGDVFARVAGLVLGLNLHDFQCGAKAIRREAWERIGGSLTETGFAWDLELIGMAHAHGLSVTEVPVVWEDAPESTVDPVATAIELGTALVRIRHRLGLRSDDPFHRLVSLVWRRSLGGWTGH